MVSRVGGQDTRPPGESARFEPYGFCSQAISGPSAQPLASLATADSRRHNLPQAPNARKPGHLAMAGQSSVEAAGVEPASAKRSFEVSTCVESC